MSPRPVKDLRQAVDRYGPAGRRLDTAGRLSAQLGRTLVDVVPGVPVASRIVPTR